MSDELIDIQDLMSLLGYTDPRSVMKWCRRNLIPVISFGLKKYIFQQNLTQYIDNQCVTFVNKEKTTALESESEKNPPKEKVETKTKKSLTLSKIVSKYITKYEN